MSQDQGSYRVVRFFKESARRQYVRGKRHLTLEQAQAHCNDPETSSRTATGREGVRRTRQYGAWFDGYENDK